MWTQKSELHHLGHSQHGITNTSSISLLRLFLFSHRWALLIGVLGARSSFPPRFGGRGFRGCFILSGLTKLIVWYPYASPGISHFSQGTCSFRWRAVLGSQLQMPALLVAHCYLGVAVLGSQQTGLEGCQRLVTHAGCFEFRTVQVLEQ